MSGLNQTPADQSHKLSPKGSKGFTRQTSRKNFGGFTIVELMIATVIFSIILLICMQTITTIGRMFYKGVTLSRTGETSRSAMDTIENDMRFAAGNNFVAQTATPPYYYCIGDQRYTYYLGAQVTDPSVIGSNGLIRQQYTSYSACSTSGSTSGNPAQLLGTGMRLTYFRISGTQGGNGLYAIDMAIANTVLGDNSALVDSTGALNNSSLISATDIKCKQGLLLNTQYCATVNLSTSVIMKGGYN